VGNCLLAVGWIAPGGARLEGDGEGSISIQRERREVPGKLESAGRKPREKEICARG